jgi:ATP-binding cassette subfamily A (ABC1) protein 3
MINYPSIIHLHLLSYRNVSHFVKGFLPPSSGTARVNGYDIRKDIRSVRSSLGLCPQHDVLFDTLTVEEHLIFFGKVSYRKSFES